MTVRGMNSTRPTAAGFTLVELMVSLVLGLLVVGGSLFVYMTSSASYRAQQATAEMIESGRTAIELISRDLRMAEYWKCIGWQTANLSNHLPYQQRGLYSDNGASGAPDTLRILRAVDEISATVTAEVELTELNTSTIPITLQANPIPVDDHTGFAANDIIVINDCAKGDVFQITGASSNSLSHSCLTCVETYAANSEVLKVDDITYSVANNARGEPSLYRTVNGGTAEELIEGVEDMQFFFGEDTDSDGIANRYVTADVINEPCSSGTNPACWLRVPTVRISLLLRTVDDNVAQEAQTYLYNGTTVTASDRRLRRPFTAVVALRNQFNQ